MNGAMNEAEPHPSIGPCVRERIKQMRQAIIKPTPTRSSLFQRGSSPSNLRVECVKGKRKKQIAVNAIP